MIRPTIFWLLIGSFLLGGCQMLGINKNKNHYGAPQKTYALDLNNNIFRGQPTIIEECDAYNISTTLWDEENRFFRIDLLAAEGNPTLNTPPFISDAALLQLALDSYTKTRAASSPVVKAVAPTYKKTYTGSVPLTMMAIHHITVDSQAAQNFPPVSGDYYYGFMLFRHGKYIYVLQHRQPFYSEEKMERVLKAMLDAVSVPADQRTTNLVNGRSCKL